MGVQFSCSAWFCRGCGARCSRRFANADDADAETANAALSGAEDAGTPAVRRQRTAPHRRRALRSRSPSNLRSPAHMPRSPSPAAAAAAAPASPPPPGTPGIMELRADLAREFGTPAPGRRGARRGARVRSPETPWELLERAALERAALERDALPLGEA